MNSLEHAHDPKTIQTRLSAKKSMNYLRDFIYGSIDGTVTTFAIVSGVVGANMSNKAIIILGIANVLADGFSMAASNYLGTKSEVDEKEKIMKYELNQLKHHPAGEIEEVRQIFLNKGFSGEVLEKIVETITKNESEWLKIMLQEEYGLSNTNRSPLFSGLSTLLAFIFFGALPLLPFIFHLNSAFMFSCIIAGVSFFLIGAFKSKWSMENFLLSGAKALMIGSLSSFIAYYTGSLLERIIS